MKEFKKDLSNWKDYNYVVINDDLTKCYKKIIKIIKSKKKITYDKKFIRQHVKLLLN